MSITGKIKNGVVVLPPGTELPEGADVIVEISEPSHSAHTSDEEDPFMAAVMKLAKPRPHWPKDYVLNHGHYVSGEPKKS